MNQPLDQSTSIGQFLAATAAKQPAPGGGAVAAIAGALASAIGEMAIAYSVGKKDLAQHQHELERTLRKMEKARQIFTELMVGDQGAFAELTEAKRSLKANEPDAAGRYKTALDACINIPRSVAATALAVLTLAESLVPIVNRFLLSDLAVCAELAMATLRCGIYNVRVNLAELTDTGHRGAVESQAADELSRGVASISRLIPAIEARMNT